MNRLSNLSFAMIQGNLVCQSKADPEQDMDKTKRIAI
jgi:hypothetical protein